MALQPSSFIVTLPKAELHLHLEGAIDPTTLLELRQRHGKASNLADIEQLYSYQDFNGFLMAFKAVTEDHALLEIVERIILVKNKIMLMTNPDENLYMQLCEIVEGTYQALMSDDPDAFARIRVGSEAITRAGRNVLNAEWARVKRGD